MFRATNVVLILLCAMYFISYIVRQSVSTARLDYGPNSAFPNTQALFIFSVFGYPYLLFQIIGRMTADKFGPRKTLFFQWPGLGWRNRAHRPFNRAFFRWSCGACLWASAWAPRCRQRLAPCSTGSSRASAALRKASPIRSRGSAMR
jgi:MFS family permease